VRGAVLRLTDDDRPNEDLLAIGRVLRPTLAKANVTPPEAAELAAGTRRCLARQLGDLVFDADRAYGLRQTLRDLARTASLARDRLSSDSWRILRSLQTEDFARRPVFATPGLRLQIAGLLGALDQGIQRLAAFSGMGMENMTRGVGWRFLDMGRRIERSIQTVALFEGLIGAEEPEDDGSLFLVLDIADSFMTYRSRYLLTPQLAPVLDLLMLDETNPRSVAFQVAALSEHLERLSRAAPQAVRSSEQRIVIGTLSDLQLADLSTLCRRSRAGDRPGLKTLLDRIATDLPQLSVGITRTYFSHADDMRTVSATHAQPG
jgi:uncharacterized alpha-E superfamily protein